MCEKKTWVCLKIEPWIMPWIPQIHWSMIFPIGEPPATATSDLSDPLQDVVPHWGDVRVGDHNPAKVGCSTMALLMIPWLKLVNQILVGQLDSSGLLLRRLEEDSIRIY